MSDRRNPFRVISALDLSFVLSNLHKILNHSCTQTDNNNPYLFLLPHLRYFPHRRNLFRPIDFPPRVYEMSNRSCTHILTLIACISVGTHSHRIIKKMVISKLWFQEEEKKDEEIFDIEELNMCASFDPLSPRKLHCTSSLIYSYHLAFIWIWITSSFRNIFIWKMIPEICPFTMRAFDCKYECLHF